MSRITCKNCGEKNERKFDKCWNCEWPLIASEAKSAEVRRGGDGFPVERLDGGERQRATSQNVRLEGNSPMGVTPLRRTTSHHGNDGELVVTPIVSHEAEATLGRR